MNNVKDKNIMHGTRDLHELSNQMNNIGDIKSG